MMKNTLLRWTAHFIPYILIFAIPVGFVVSLLLQKDNFAINGLILGIPTFAAAILILKIQTKESDFTTSSVLFPFNQQSLVRIFFFIFTISIIITLVSATKSTVFLILIVSLYCVILIQIFSKNPSVWIIITEIVLALILFIYTTTVTSSYYFGATDIIPHSFFSTVTSSTGHVISPDLSEYSFFPLYHIWIASGSLITGLNSYKIINILTCPVFAISAIFVYFLFVRIIKNQQIALLTCLLYSLSSVIVFYGTYVVTRTMAFIGFLILLYLLYNAKIKNRGLIFKSLAIIISVYIILVHNVSTPMILMLLTILVLCEWIIGQQKYISIYFLILMTSFFIVYWLFYSISFTTELISNELNIENFQTPTVISTSFQNSAVFGGQVFLTNYFHFLILLFFGILGIFYLIWRKKPSYTPVFGLFALITIVLYVPTPLQTLTQTMSLLRFDRFQILTIPFMVLMMAWGIWVLSKYLSQINVPVKIISFIIVLFFLIYSCSSVGLIQYKTIEKTSLRLSFNADELTGYDFIQKNIPSNSRIFTDSFSTRYLFQSFDSKTIQDITKVASNGGYFVITKKQLLSHGLLFSRGGVLNPEGSTYSYLPTNENIDGLYRVLNLKNQIYSSHSIDVYISYN